MAVIFHGESCTTIQDEDCRLTSLQVVGRQMVGNPVNRYINVFYWLAVALAVAAIIAVMAQ